MNKIVFIYVTIMNKKASMNLRGSKSEWGDTGGLEGGKGRRETM